MEQQKTQWLAILVGVVGGLLLAFIVVFVLRVFAGG